MQAEVEELLGRKYSRDKQTDSYRWGSQAGSVVVGAQKAPIAKPRVRARLADGSSEEISLESYAAFNKPESMNKAVLNRLLSGVSSRDFSRTVEQVNDAAGLSKSNFSRKNHRLKHRTSR
jgi:putative transposase